MRMPIGLITSIVFCCASSGWAQPTPPANGGSAPGSQPNANAPPAGGAPISPPVQPVFMRQTVFAIPFAVSQADQSGQEVHLFVSADRGISWGLYAREPATKGQFAFQAARDGEYWFASQTVPIGTMIAAGTRLSPELKVIVDTTGPKLDIQASVDRGGKIVVNWDVADEQVQPESLKIEYQSALGEAWQAVRMDRPAIDPGSNTLRGQTSWQPEGGGRFVSVRAEVQDMAGNSNRVIRRLLVPTSVARNAPPAPRTHAATDVPSDPLAANGLTAESSDAAGGSHFGSPPTDPPAQQSTATEVAPYAYRIGADVGEPDDKADESATAGQTAAAAPAATSWPSDVETDPNATSHGQTRADFASSGGRAPADSQKAEAGAASERTSSAGAAASITATEQASQNAEPYGLPPGERPRMTRTTRFNLAYSVDAAGPMGLEKVELWVTRNGGGDWNLWGTDEDMESPFLVDVDSEGIYGFRVVLVSRNGLASQTPRPGDLADLWVGIDTTAPTGEITSAAYGEDAHAGHLNIQWAAADDHLSPRPITLALSETQKGPWTPIASGLPNNGQYFWRVDSGVPDKFYLRLEVRDEAGNLTVDQLTQPIQSAGLTPKGRVSDFEPLFE